MTKNLKKPATAKHMTHAHGDLLAGMQACRPGMYAYAYMVGTEQIILKREKCID